MLSIRDVARKLNISVRGAYRLLGDGLTHYLIGGLIRVNEADLNAYLEENRKCLSGKIEKGTGIRPFSEGESEYIKAARSRGGKRRRRKPNSCEVFTLPQRAKL